MSKVLTTNNKIGRTAGKSQFKVGLILSLLLVGYYHNVSAEIEWSVETGYRSDFLQWSIAGPNNTPNIISELTWRNLDIVQTKTGINYRNRRFDVGAEIGYGKIYNGDNQDSDYAGDDRTLEFSRSNNQSNGDNVYDINTWLGIVIDTPAKPAVRFIPMLGYSGHIQRLRMTDGVQTVSEPNYLQPGEYNPVPLGPFSGLNSTYKSRWHGPWLGAKFLLPVTRRLTLVPRFEKHWAHYYAEADWNLRKDFSHPKSYEQDTVSKGLVLSLLTEYSVSRPLHIYLDVNYQKWVAAAGSSYFFFDNGDSATVHLNGVSWKSYAVNLGLKIKIN